MRGHILGKTGWLSLGVLWWCAVSPVWALTVTPGRTELRLSPGNKMEAELTATNETQDLLHVNVATKDWFLLPENKTKKLHADQWLKVPKDTAFDLKPGQSHKLKVGVECPKEAVGELVGMVSFLTQTDKPSMVTPVISVSVYVAVAGTEKIAGEIREIQLRTNGTHLQAAVAMLATGNVHLRPLGSLAVMDKDGDEVMRFPLQGGTPTYPGQIQPYPAVIQPDFKLEPGKYTAQAKLEYRGLTWESKRGFTVQKDGLIQMDADKAEAKTK